MKTSIYDILCIGFYAFKKELQFSMMILVGIEKSIAGTKSNNDILNN